ncbi:MAG: ribonuclease P protein component [Alphaproteobacteria bacterium]|nr:ribonuclease P protein component [Alphaproteobacteria bacterium]
MAGKSSPIAGPTGGKSCLPEITAAPAAAPIARIKVRRDFLKAAQGGRVATDAFILQAVRQGPTPTRARVGFTVTKKIGNAVTRNRARRRLKEAARQVLPLYAQHGTDYVLVGRRGALTRPMAVLMADLAAALRRVNQQGDKAAPSRKSRKGADQ